MSIVETEQVLVIPTGAFYDCGYFQGFSRETEGYVERLLRSDQLEFRPRGDMECNPSFKQLIPYCLFRHVDAAGVARLFRYRRMGGGEARLDARMSVGVGGHISSLDAGSPGRDAYRVGLQRELDEEVRIDSVATSTCVGLINDDETSVGQVHLGIVHLFDVNEPLVSPREASMGDAGFVTLAELKEDFEQLESWSQICLRALFEL